MTGSARIEDDWRYETAKFLRGQAFEWKPYRVYREGWDHDHCAGCTAKFMAAPGPDILTEGWAVDDTYRLGPEYEWVCSECFDLLSGPLGWTGRRADP